MMLRDADPTGFIRTSIALALCLMLFVLDGMSGGQFGLAQFYPVALLALYGVRRPYRVELCWAVAVLLIVGGYLWIEPTPPAAGMGSRAGLLVLVTLTAFALN